MVTSRMGDHDPSGLCWKSAHFNVVAPGAVWAWTGSGTAAAIARHTVERTNLLILRTPNIRGHR